MSRFHNYSFQNTLLIASRAQRVGHSDQASPDPLVFGIKTTDQHEIQSDRPRILAISALQIAGIAIRLRFTASR